MPVHSKFHFSLVFTITPMRPSTRLLSVAFLISWFFSGCGLPSDSDTADKRASASPPAAHDTTNTADPTADSPATLLGALRTMTERLAALPATRFSDRDAAHQLAEYYHGAISLTEVMQQHGRDTTLRRLATALAQDQQAQLQAAQHLATRLDADTASAGLLGSAYGQRLQAARQQLEARAKGTVGEAGREAHAPNLAMMQGDHDEGTGNVDADFATLVVQHQQAVARVSQVIQALGTDPPLKALAARSVASSLRTIAQLQAWRASRRGGPR